MDYNKIHRSDKVIYSFELGVNEMGSVFGGIRVNMKDALNDVVTETSY